MNVSRSTTFAIVASAIGALALVAVPTRPSVPVVAVAPQPVTPVSVVSTSRATPSTRVRTEDALVWGRDPFSFAPRPATPASPVRPSPEPKPVHEPVVSRRYPALTGIAVGEDGNLAILDRELVREGQELPSGYLVTNIDRTSVTIRRGDREVTLSLPNAR